MYCSPLLFVCVPGPQAASAKEVYAGVTYRRLDAWLPHGLAPRLADNATAAQAALLPQFSLCAVRLFGCTPVPLGTLELLSRGAVRLSVPSLAPGSQYTLSVAGSPDIQDGYGLPLQPSAATFWTQRRDHVFAGPSFSQPQSILFEPPASGGAPGLSYPFISAGAQEEGSRSAAYWRLDLGSEAGAVEALNLLFNGNGDVYLPDKLGSPAGEVTHAAGEGGAAALQRLAMSGGSGAYLTHVCCSLQHWPTRRQVSTGLSLALSTHLTASVVMANSGEVVVWVADTRGPGAAAVGGASVVLFNNDYPTKNNVVVGRCTTDAATGACTIALAAPSGGDGRRAAHSYGSLSLWVTSEGAAPLLLPNAGYATMHHQADYVTSVVLDRRVVQPGQTLHVAGYLAQRAGSSTALPSASSAVLQVSPPWSKGEAAGGGRAEATQSELIAVDIDPTYGTFTTTIDVPTSAKMARYSLMLQLPNPQGGSKGKCRVVATHQLHLHSLPYSPVHNCYGVLSMLLTLFPPCPPPRHPACGHVRRLCGVRPAAAHRGPVAQRARLGETARRGGRQPQRVELHWRVGGRQQGDAELACGRPFRQ